MTLHAIRSGRLHTIEATPYSVPGYAEVVSGDLHPGSVVTVSGPARRWLDSAAEAWEAEANRLDMEADRAAHRARAASVEAEKLEGRAGVARGAVEARGTTT